MPDPAARQLLGLRRSTVTLELAIKQALEGGAPDLEGLEVEGVQTAPAASGPVLPLVGNGGALPIQHVGTPAALVGAAELPLVNAGRPASACGSHADGSGVATAATWRGCSDVDGLRDGEMIASEVAGEELLVANVGGTLLAYHDRCAGCDAPLHVGELRDGALTCRACARTFFLPRAGRSLADEQLQLLPVPLLRERDSVKVALVA